ncbi:hypothetical protein QA612_14050 [Evansella sp. AB-P1]|uniref:hypothetical protein n=1 Tax=Evansella sp. AB-P1 TaxID=3037653 RepID=UPI00241F96AE|nr:hypothetical protein [Evansella sp. AB-P1]MDG5788604.1 hypothetical protein [Evansella sp. AB-P1]
MKKMFALFTLVFLLVGCNSELSFSKENVKKVKKDVQEFFERVEDVNGTYLYYDSEDTIYLLLNGKNVVQGEQAIHFEDFHTDAIGDTLHLYFNEGYTDDYINKSLNHQMLYKISKVKDYEYIKLIKNGMEDSFAMVSGTGR